MAITYNPNNFSGKDAVNAVLTGVDFDVEFNAISNALGLAAPVAAPNFSGNVDVETLVSTGNVTVGGDLTVTGQIVEDTIVNVSLSGGYTIGSGSAALVFHTASGSVTYSESIVEGQNITLMLNPNGQSIAWPASIKWVGGNAPDLDNNVHNIISLWKVNNILFGSWGGSVDAS